MVEVVLTEYRNQRFVLLPNGEFSNIVKVVCYHDTRQNASYRLQNIRDNVNNSNTRYSCFIPNYSALITRDLIIVSNWE